MSNILRNRQGNLSKVKYFLPAHRNYDDSQPSQIIKNSLPKKSKPVQSKKPSINKTMLNKSVHQNDDISLQIVGIHQVSDQKEKQNQYSINKHMFQSKPVAQNKLNLLKKAKLNSKAAQASFSSIKALTNAKQWLLPEGAQKEEFYSFIQTLKNDETYQQTVTMFTIMYFYEQKRKKTK